MVEAGVVWEWVDALYVTTTGDLPRPVQCAVLVEYFVCTAVSFET